MDQDKIWESFGRNGQKQSPRCLAVNTVLAGKYLVGPVLGEGGFGITYAGYDLNMKTRIAIKEYFPVELVSRDTTRLSEGGGSDRVISLSGEKSKTYRQGLQKYVDEARSVSRFSGTPGIVSVKDFFYENDTAYIVMEYIEGVSLKEYLKQKGGKLPEEEALAILRPVLEALEQVHGAGIVHRDISPDNIMLTFAGEGGSSGESDAAGKGTETVHGNIASVRLIDFGAARMTAKNDQKSLTIILKHGYAPEEQYRSHGEQGPWTDVYALCAVLYRMLTGTVPEPAMDRLFSDDLKRPEELGAAVSPAVSDAVMKGLAVKKENRIRSMRELSDALYAGKRLKTDRAKKRCILTIAALAAGLFVLAGAAAGIGAAVLDFGPLKTGTAVQDSAGQDTMEAEDDGSTEQESSLESALSGESALLLEETQEDEEWEIVAVQTPQTSCAGGLSHAVFLREDGTVTSCGSNGYGQRNLEEWSRVAAVAAGDTFTAGLLENGTVVVAGELEGKADVERWENVTSISACDGHLLGLTADGKILANQGYGKGTDTSFLEWEDVKAVCAGLYVAVAVTGDGTVHAVGFEGWQAAAITGWEDVTALACSQTTVFGLTRDGSVKYAKLWENWSDINIDERFEGIENFQNVAQLYVRPGEAYGVTADGRLLAAGSGIPEEVDGWEGLRGIAGTLHENNLAGMGTDGALVKYSPRQGNSAPEEMAGLEKVFVFNGIGEGVTSLIGITEDHSLLTFGNSSRLPELEKAADVQQVGELYYTDSIGISYGFAWLDRAGTLYSCDQSNFFQPVPLLQNGEQLVTETFGYYSICAVLENDGTVALIAMDEEAGIPDGFEEAEEWTEISQIAGCSGRVSTGILLGLREDGTVVSAAHPGYPGRLEGDWTQIASLYAGDYAIGAIRKDGTAQFLEDRPEYNYGQYNTSGWEDLTQLALGQYHTAGLRSDGTVYATGRNDAGQCDVEGWTDIVYIAAGDSCTVGVRADGTLAVAGELGW